MSIVLQTITLGLCSCSLTCLQHLIPSTNRLSFAGWITPSAYVAHPGSGSTPTSTNAVTMSELVIASRHLSAATTECLEAVCLVPCYLPYTSPIANFIAPFTNVHHAQYADNTQLYIALSSDRAFNVINDCFQSVHRWLDGNGFSLNPGKFKAIVIRTSTRQWSELQIKDVTVTGVPVTVTRTVKSLSVTTDNMLSFDDHTNNVCTAAHFHIRVLRQIHHCVSVDDAKMVASATVSSRLNYCNSILYGTSLSNLNKL